jgi:hypothetical protein
LSGGIAPSALAYYLPYRTLQETFHGQRSSKIRQHRSTNFFIRSVTGMFSVNKLGTYMIPKAKKQWRQKPIIKETAIKPEQLVKMT